MYSSPDQKALWWLDYDSPNAKMTPEEARVTTLLKVYLSPPPNRTLSINLGLEAYGWSIAPPAMQDSPNYTFPTLTQLHLRTQVYILTAESHH